MTPAEIIYNQPHLINKILYKYKGLSTPSAMAFKKGTKIHLMHDNNYSIMTQQIGNNYKCFSYCIRYDSYEEANYLFCYNMVNDYDDNLEDLFNGDTIR